MELALGQEDRNKPRNYDLSNARDELNLTEWPIFYLGQRVPNSTKTLSYENTVYDAARNRTITRRLDIVGSEAYGLPTVRDADVLLALIMIGKQSNDFQSRAVSFSRYELVEILGWGDSGRSYARIDEALKKWMSVTLFFKNSWWNKEDSEWKTEGFHLLEKISISDSSKRRGQNSLRLSSCTFSEVFYNSLKNNNIKKLNLAELYSLKVPAAKQMYRFLEKRLYKRRHVTFDLREFACGHVGFSREHTPSKLKDKLKPAIRELVAIGIIEDVPVTQRYTKVGHGTWEIHFSRPKEKKVTDIPLKGNKKERFANRLLMKEMTDCGLSVAVAQKIAENEAIGEDRVREKIEYLHWLCDQGEPPKKPAGWLRKAIEEDWPLPANFKTKVEREVAKEKAKEYEQEKLRQKENERRRIAAEREKARTDWERIESHLESLSSKERESLIDDALSNPDNDSYRVEAQRYRVSGKPGMPAMCYEFALTNHIMPILKENSVTT